MSIIPHPRASLKESTTARGRSSIGSAFHAFARDPLVQLIQELPCGGFNLEMLSTSTTQKEESEQAATPNGRLASCLSSEVCAPVGALLRSEEFEETLII